MNSVAQAGFFLMFQFCCLDKAEHDGGEEKRTWMFGDKTVMVQLAYCKEEKAVDEISVYLLYKKIRGTRGLLLDVAVPAQE
ncbi:Uncharacterized protein TCM_017185 [Theobroma cacao]|uniref:Uncharacterized protein n=1 Tax=Theobroma cacao TaxID=3641 RepID=A0A061EKH9_THECC|nr:Uncharacterized protein TCM_017185 [Theobroma cacao]